MSNLATWFSNEIFLSIIWYSSSIRCIVLLNILISCFSYISKCLALRFWHAIKEDDTLFNDVTTDFLSGEVSISVVLQFNEYVLLSFILVFFIQFFIFKVLAQASLSRMLKIVFRSWHGESMLLPIMKPCAIVSTLTLINLLSLINLQNWQKFSFNHSSLLLMGKLFEFWIKAPRQWIWSSFFVNQASSSGVRKSIVSSRYLNITRKLEVFSQDFYIHVSKSQLEVVHLKNPKFPSFFKMEY